MNNRSGPVTFFLFLFLLIMILLQVLSMIQSDRLYERLNLLLDRAVTGRIATGLVSQKSEGKDLPGEPYPGDEGDWLVWCLSAEPSTLNYIHTTSTKATQWITLGSIFETLLEYDPNEVTLRPDLAESYEISEDGLEIYFRIRDEAHFSDGQPVTADDIIFTHATIMNPKVDAAYMRSYYSIISEIVKISDKEVKFVMREVYFKSLEIAGGIYIFPKHVYDFNDPAEFNKHISNPIGSGPYIFEKWNVGKEVVLRRNENYWGHKPKLEKIIYRIITNDTAAVQAMRTDQIDYMRPVPDQYTDLCSDKEFTKKTQCLSYWHPGAGYFWIGWNQSRPFFTDRKVRLALTHLVDREAIKEYILRNTEAQIPTGPFYIYGKQNNSDIEPWPYDPDRARELLDEAGWIDTDGDGIRDKDGVPFRFKYMIVGGTYLHEQIAKLVKDSASKAGIDVVLEPYEWSIFSERVNDRKFDAVNMAWLGGLESDPYHIWHSSQIGNRGANYVGFNNAQADRIIEKARRTLDRNKRNELYHHFHQILHEEQPYTFIYTRPEQRFLDRRFKNVKIYKLGIDEFEWYVPRDEQRYK